jgi:hypothetical protein
MILKYFLIKNRPLYIVLAFICQIILLTNNNINVRYIYWNTYYNNIEKIHLKRILIVDMIKIWKI